MAGEHGLRIRLDKRTGTREGLHASDNTMEDQTVVLLVLRLHAEGLYLLVLDRHESLPRVLELAADRSPAAPA
eukprot:CAMPEP_0115532862 /NCGR_PEP_ID=MMETSP0271-20121206/85805_1 /TAXON_ID=71861 /ORGANISM="Scrippsiella trochoidea, Strain CCMP3099" /LENGTH=72 /DNA_ID=CAMNT_0002965187 /DNA_START=15 /DNA_END=229 /DNA_ORIENTATION=-